MAEYTELILELRKIGRKIIQFGNPIYNELTAQRMLDAADTIEFLQTYKVAFENIVSMGGWWLVGQDRNLHHMDVPMNWPPKGTKTVELFPLPRTPKEEPTCKDCQRECQMIGLDMEACASYEPPKEET
jgi:hypothetical protein